MKKILSLPATLLVYASLAGTVLAQEGSTLAPTPENPLNTAFTPDLGDALISGVQTHPGAVAGIVLLWLAQTIIKFILATTTTKDTWWYKGLEVAAGIVGKVKQPKVK